MENCLLWVTKNIGSEVFGELGNMLLEEIVKIKWSGKMNKKEVLKCIRGNRTPLNMNLPIGLEIT